MAADIDSVKRHDLYAEVWRTLAKIAETAAPGSITPQTFARVAVDVVLKRLLEENAISPVYRDGR